MSETLLCALFLAVIFISLFVILAVLIEILDKLKDIRKIFNFDYLLNKTEEYVSKNKKKGDSYGQRDMGDPQRKIERPEGLYPQDRSTSGRKTDLIGTPCWWLQFCYDENFKQENPVLYTILEAFAKDEQRRYQEENEVLK